MVKRELSTSSDGGSSDSSIQFTSIKRVKYQPRSEQEHTLDGAPKAKSEKGSKGKRGPNRNKSTKTAWSAEEDAILQGILDDVIKTHLWPEIKKDGRLVHRTSYGVQYHAKMLLRQGAKGTSGK